MLIGMLTCVGVNNCFDCKSGSSLRAAAAPRSSDRWCDQAAGQSQGRSMTGFRLCYRSCLGARMTQPLAVIGAFLRATRTTRTSRKTKKKSAQTGRSFFYSKKPKQGCSLLRISRSPAPVKFEFTTLLLQMTTPQTRVNAGVLFTTLFACLRL